MESKPDLLENQWSRAAAAAEITAPALERGLPHMALDAAREAARSALLALAAAPRRPSAPDLGLLREVASALPRRLAGRPAERLAMIRATLSVVEPLFPRPPATVDRNPPGAPAQGGLTAGVRIGMRPEARPGPTAGAAMACAGDGLSDRRAGLEDERILVVEDEVLVSMLVEDELRGAGAEVLGPVPTVGDALRLVEAAAADGGLGAAVLDINLAGRHVAPVADRLAALGVPFLFATGYGEGCDTGGHGAAPVLRKPFAPARLVAAVATLASAGGAAVRRMGLFQAEPGSGVPPLTAAVPCRRCPGTATPHGPVSRERTGGGRGSRR